MARKWGGKKFSKNKLVTFYWIIAALTVFFIQGANARGIMWIFLVFAFFTYYTLKNYK